MHRLTPRFSNSIFDTLYQQSCALAVTELSISVFFIFFNNNKLFFGIFCQVNNLFLHQSYLKSPLPVKLT